MSNNTPVKIAQDLYVKHVNGAGYSVSEPCKSSIVCAIIEALTYAPVPTGEQVDFDGVRRLMFWSAKTAHEMIKTGKSEEDIIDEIERKLEGLSTSVTTVKYIEIL